MSGDEDEDVRDSVANLVDIIRSVHDKSDPPAIGPFSLKQLAVKHHQVIQSGASAASDQDVEGTLEDIEVRSTQRHCRCWCCRRCRCWCCRRRYRRRRRRYRCLTILAALAEGLGTPPARKRTAGKKEFRLGSVS